MSRIYHPYTLSDRTLKILPTPAHFAQQALHNAGYIFSRYDNPAANPTKVYNIETYIGIIGYDGDRIYVEDAPGLDLLSQAVLAMR